MRRLAWLFCWSLTGCYGAADLSAAGSDLPELGGDPTYYILPSGSDGGTYPQGADSGQPVVSVPEPDGDGGLPCDVSALLEQHCQSCHRTPPVGGAPMPLLTYADLVGPAKSNPSMHMYDVVVSRMKDANRPMPPGGMLSAEDIAVIEQWQAAGAPAGSCGPSDGGTDPIPTETVCTSGRYWDDPDDGSSRMNPGRACISCHSSADDDDAPNLWVGGTVYPTFREPNMCLGANGTSTYAGASVEIEDATGKVVSLSVNASGNFLLQRNAATLTFPIRARVLYNGKVRQMGTPQYSGDCNSCHTETGANGAPGRIALP
jgi:hypothetical protein